MTDKATSRPLKFIAAFLGSAIIALAASCFLPHDKYIRYQALDLSEAIQSTWIYERIHFDKTPIDIAFIGSSRTKSAIHTGLLESELAAGGVTAKAVNLHIVLTGRNLHFSIAKDLLKSKKVKLLVVELTEVEDRLGHDNFIVVADASDVVTAPLVINFNFAADLIRLPGRQIDLFLKTLESRAGLVDREFHPERYLGPNLDHAERHVLRKGGYMANEDFPGEAALDDLKRERDRGDTPVLMPPSLDWLEFRYPRLYMSKIDRLAAMHGAKVAYVYLGRYHGPLHAAREADFATKGPVFRMPDEVIQTPLYWSDASHLNWSGAQIVTRNVASEILRSGVMGPVEKTAPAVTVARPSAAAKPGQ